MPGGKYLEHYNILLKKKEALWRKIRTTYELIAGLPDRIDYFLSRASNVDDHYETGCQVVQDLIEYSVQYPDLDVEWNTESEELDRLYYEVKAVYRKYIKEIESEIPAVTPINQVSQVKSCPLPRLDIPKFAGSYDEFPGYRALFDELVHNSDQLSEIEKFSYLISTLSGSALKLVQTVVFSPSNYTVAYDLLKDHYTNKRLMSVFYLNKIFSTPPVKRDSPRSLQEFIDTLQASVTSLKDLKIPKLDDFILLFWALRLLDTNSRVLFEQSMMRQSAEQMPTFGDLITFLRKQNMIADLMHIPQPSLSHMNERKSYGDKRKVLTVMSKSTEKAFTPGMCPVCQDKHPVFRCPTFMKASIEKRMNLVRQHRLCFGCLGFHRLDKCESRWKCQFCQKRHHSLLHFQEINKPAESESMRQTHQPNVDEVKEKVNSGGNEFHQTMTSLNTIKVSELKNNMKTVVFLGTARVYLTGYDGTLYKARAIIDSGSAANFMTTSLASQLGLARAKCGFEVSGIGGDCVVKNFGQVTTSVTPHFSAKPVFGADFVVVSRITHDLPSSDVTGELSDVIKSLKLADPDFSKPGKIDLLLGVQAYLDICVNSTPPIKGKPSAMLTKLGWLVMGEHMSTNIGETRHSLLSLLVTDENRSLDQTLRAFWEREEVEVVIPLNPEDEYCEKYYKETVLREEDGRYQVRLPFKNEEKPNLGSTRQVALHRLNNLEKRFNKDETFHKLYCDNMADYVDQAHMVEASRPSEYIMTHHAVQKESREGRKVRVVFSPKEMDAQGLSLNSVLLPGPKLQKDIGQVISVFRLNKFALVCDIKQMYREISLHPDDRKYQHIFWRWSPQDKVVEYEMCRVTFGVTSSPFLAQRTLQQLVSDEGSRWPQAAKVVKESSFVDDLLGGADTEEGVLRLKRELESLLSSGCFKLGKWASSIDHVLQEEGVCELPSEDASAEVKILGLWWDASTDEFRFKGTCDIGPMTKRGILSRIARFYDYNGYLAPVTLYMKWLLQKLWIAGVSWDEEIPDETAQKWKSLIDQLQTLEEVRIPRWTLLNNMLRCDLIGFCDASQYGMAAVVYLRVESIGEIKIRLLKAKTRIAPLKSWTIPRLELGSAHLLSLLVKVTLPLSDLKLTSVRCFSDSTNVLAWLATPPYRLNTFVSNRVVGINENAPDAVWSHVTTDQNPADPASRGVLPARLLDNELWWNGPDFLRKQPSDWPTTPRFEPVLELKKSEVDVCVGVPSNVEWLALTERFSSFLKLQRVMAYVLRFLFNLRVKQLRLNVTTLTGPISVDEYREAHEIVVSVVQQHYLGDQIRNMKQGRVCSTRLAPLSPFLASDGSVRVGGRLTKAQLAWETKHPLLIPRESHLAKLLCHHFHEETGHGGPKLVQSLLQHKYWIPSARRLIRTCVQRCLVCYRLRFKTIQPQMAELPACRVSPNRPFTHVGVDMGGPILMKTGALRSSKVIKGYFAIFVCMTTKAIHLEVVSNLTTPAFLASLNRFIARRGLPACIYTDRGKNFQGAAREIKEVDEFMRTSELNLVETLAKREIKWKMNAPYSPNQGGLWEAGVKAVKSHLKRIIGLQSLNFEELSTVLSQIEAMVNSRPVCVVSNVPDDGFRCLTPGHFLIGAPLLSRPEEDVSETPINRLTRWKLLQKLTQTFWKKWSVDYLHTQVSRQKWVANVPNLKVGEIVLYFVPGVPTCQWPIGRIVEVFPGSDGIVRNLTIRTATGVVERSARRIARLPIE